MTEPTDWIADAERAGIALREVIRTAHEATRDLRQVIKEWEALKASIPVVAQKAFDELMGEAVAEGLKEYGATIQHAIEQAQIAVDRRFQKVADILMGEDKPGDKTLTQYAKEVRRIRDQREN